MDFIIGFLLSSAIAFLAFKKQSLDISGFIAATIIGTMIYGFGTYVIFILLMAFFISSSIISKFKEEEKNKGRNIIQVLANSFITVVFCFLFYITKNDLFLLISAISIAVSTADTWASEIGKLGKGKTVSIITFKPIKKGESGGISILGIFASLLGALMIAGLFILMIIIFKRYEISKLISFGIIIIGGFMGSVLDSVLGILIQEKYVDIKTGIIFEKMKLGYDLIYKSGIKYVNNDMVNLLSSMIITSVFTIILV